jgi:hypothetical protein
MLRQGGHMKKLSIAVTLALALIATGCAKIPMASMEADSSAKSFRTEPGKANVYIYRNETFGAAVKMSVLIDNVWVGDTAAKTYILRQVEPGPHTIVSKAEKDAFLTLDTKAGANYFVWQEIKMGAFAARSQLHLVDESRGMAGVAACKLVK